MLAELRLAHWHAPAHGRTPLRNIGMLKPASASNRSSQPRTKRTVTGLVLTAVIAAHLLVFAALLAQSAMAPLPVDPPVNPIMVSLVSELAPVAEALPVKPALKQAEPEPKPKPVAKPKHALEPEPKPEPKPIAQPAPQPAVDRPAAQATTPQPIPQQPMMQQPVSPPPPPPPEPVADTPSPAPVAPAPITDEAPPAPAPEAAAVEPPSFGAAYLNNPPPRYPSLSRRLGEEGRVLLRVLVAKNGSADTVEVEKGSGSERLDEAALEAVRKWKFVPARQNNQPISAYVLVPMKFSLRDS